MTMHVEQKNTTDTEDIIIHDPEGTFKAWALVACLIALPFWALFDGLGIKDFLLFSIFLFPLAYFFFLMAKAKTSGVRLSISEKSIQYPGGSIAAESFISYLTPSYWIQCTKRHSTNFSDITQISTKKDTTIGYKIGRILSAGSKRSNYAESKSFRYGVQFDGSFGSVIVYFRNEQKRSQLFGVLRQQLKAGVPVVGG